MSLPADDLFVMREPDPTVRALKDSNPSSHAYLVEPMELEQINYSPR
jgi:hypothetical protein